MAKKFDKELLEILACPVCKSELEYREETEQLECKKCHRKYPIEDGVPIMLVEKAEV